MDKQTQKELFKIVSQNYNEVAKQFSETRKKWLWPELIKLAKQISDKDKVLDVGCGSGRLLNAFLGKDISYLGVDNSNKLLNLARQEFPDYEFRKGSITELGKISQLNFDYVFSIAVLHHLPGYELRVDSLKQLKNKIHKDGKIILTVWNLWSQKKYRKLIINFAMFKFIKKNKMDFGDIIFDWKNNKGKIVSKRYYHAFTRRELKKLAKEAKLKIEKLYKDKYNYYIILKK